MNGRNARVSFGRHGSRSTARFLAPHALLTLALAFAAIPAGAVEWEVGTRFGFETRAAGFDDPYAFSLGVGVFAEIVPLETVPLRLGVSLSRYSFDSRSPVFGDSTMPTPGVYVGYPVYRVADDSIAWRVEPYVEYRHYRRRHEFFGSQTETRRPLSALGIGVVSVRRSGVSTGAAVEYQTIWDNNPVHRAAVSLRLGIGSRPELDGVQW